MILKKENEKGIAICQQPIELSARLLSVAAFVLRLFRLSVTIKTMAMTAKAATATMTRYRLMLTSSSVGAVVGVGVGVFVVAGLNTISTRWVLKCVVNHT